MSLPLSILEAVLAAVFVVVCVWSFALLIAQRRAPKEAVPVDLQDRAWRRRALIGLFLGIAFVLGLLPFMVQARHRSIASIYNNPRLWISPKLVADRQYANFAWRFNELDSVVVSWPGCNINDPRLDRLAQELTNSADPQRRAACAMYFGQVLTGTGVVRDLTGRPLRLTQQEAVQRLQGVLVGLDGESSCAIVRLLEAGTRERDKSLTLLFDVAAEVSQIAPAEIMIGGAPVDGLIIDRQSVTAAGRLSMPSNLLVLALCIGSLRSWRLTFVVFGLGMFAQLLTISMTDWCGFRLNAIYLVMPPLLLVLTVSAGVHLVNYYHDEVRHSLPGQPGSIARRAIMKGMVPCTMAAGTTALGLISLLASQSPPVARFGAISALAVVVVITLLFLMLSGAMEFWASKKPRPAWTPWGKEATRELILDRFTVTVSRSRYLIIAICLASMIVAGYGLTKMKMSVSIHSLFRPDSDIIQRYRWLEEHIGPLVTVETILRFRTDDETSPLARARVVNDVHRAILRMDDVGGVISATTFLPDLAHDSTHTTGGVSLGLFTTVAVQDRLQRLQFVHRASQAEYWRISARISALENIDYGEFLETIEDRVQPILNQAKADLGIAALSATYTGPMPLTYRAQRSLLRDLINSFLTALGLIFLVMWAYLRSVRAGLVAMIPNLFPTVLLFGLTSLGGMEVNIGAVMTASVALGIAVDDTLHFVTWFRRELAKTGSRYNAVRRSYGHCASAMVQSTIICGIGLLIYTLSPFIPTQRFALMMLMLLLAALAGDLLLLPSLLLSPMGEWLQPRRESD